MSLINNKNVYRTILIISFILLNLLLLLGINKTLTFLNTGAERTSMLHLEKETINSYLPKTIWESDTNAGRAMEANTLKEVEKDYLFSWLVKNKSFKDNTKLGIEDYYTQNTRANLYQTISHNKKNNITIESTTLEHHPKLDFYSADGQLVVFTDRNVVEFQKIYKKEKLISTVEDTATYKVMMLLEDGFWRVRHMQKMKKEVLVADTIKPHPLYTIQGQNILKDKVAYTIKGINYYPKNSAWDTFGPLFNLDTISKDFDIINKAKLNSIRIFIQYDDFGKADVKQEKLDKLKKMLDLAESKNLSVIVTLFDFYSDYTLENWTLTHRHAENIVSTFKNHNAILAWDLKNEPNLDFENRDKDNVLNWLNHMVSVIKKFDPNHLVTIGWSNSYEATRLANKVDFVSYHFYNAVEDFEKENTLLEKAVKKPVVIQEFGVPSYNGIWNLRGYSEADQAQYHKRIQALFKKNKLAFMSWTLYDFPHVPSQVAGKWPWQKIRQKKFGFIDEKGNKKQSFLYITY
ncbi:glycosyl hydrolase family 5 [Flavobacterium sp. ALD4]|uniref:glycoside hydrolase family 2 TIM barrel-domain containing protein n=1 Tax=Flavobacterium sp. ALD4 TaxID=2058314 RepID=UPI000C325552|nr:glycoside hydrolase family 2 TIM barrel-domain containing protein [Flavobacterium sp. ALD4]PKH67025.1 glycosyl hydrolase family 5 [Flavobacterium sp. ALD4]